jgi:hypothetical protein
MFKFANCKRLPGQVSEGLVTKNSQVSPRCTGNGNRSITSGYMARMLCFTFTNSQISNKAAENSRLWLVPRYIFKQKSHGIPQKKLACLKGVVFWWDDFWLGICWIFLDLVWTWHKYKSLDKSSHWSTKLQRFLRWFRLATPLRKYIFWLSTQLKSVECFEYWIYTMCCVCA